DFPSKYSGLNLNQDKATKPQTVQIVRQGEATPYWFLLIHYKKPPYRISRLTEKALPAPYRNTSSKIQSVELKKI
ncbi:TPA: hypothetical protein ACLA0P_001339, partial [Neisseria meningitidis]